jgi:RND family efflux transporter MFP subunit
MMVSTQNRRLGITGLLLGGCALALIYFVPGRETVDANERIKTIVETASLVEAAKPFELSLAEVTRVSRAPATERLRISGEVQPVRSVILRSRSAGRITEVAVQEGQKVKAGDILVRFETADLRSTLQQRQSDRDVADAELSLSMMVLQRATQLAAKDVAPAEKLEKAKSDVAVARARLQSLSAQVDMARVSLREAEVVAPFDGTVSAKMVDVGTRVGTDADLVTLVDMTEMEVKALVSTRDITRIKLGQTAQLQFDGMEDHTIDATVGRVNPAADNGARFVAVYLRLPAQEASLWGGMFATGSILVRENSDALLIPAIALRSDKNGDYVLKIENGYLRRQPVTVGSAWDGGALLEISDGLSEGDTIITAPLSELRPDRAVTLSKVG